MTSRLRRSGCSVTGGTAAGEPMSAARPAVIDYERAVFAMTQRISGNAGFPATRPNCERIARETLKPLLPKPRKL